jgi:hypothetical protein
MTPAYYDAEILLAGLDDLEPSDRIAAVGRLLEELHASIARQHAKVARTEEILAAVLIIEARSEPTKM